MWEGRVHNFTTFHPFSGMQGEKTLSLMGVSVPSISFCRLVAIAAFLVAIAVQQESEPGCLESPLS